MNDPSPLEAIFFAALEKGSPEERAAYLDESCAGDPDLRRRVEKMLAAQAQAGSFLDAPASALIDAPRADKPDTWPTARTPPVEEPTLPEGPGSLIGPYKLMEQIGEGGMGLVFVAEQQHPVRRKVALKVIKPGMDTRQVIARFEAERQALALMDHPHIAKVLDGGATASGRPYFVMELVKGTPITDCCDQDQLSVRACLELFLQVCMAVQHAHQKGIIHRDIKPSNVLVVSHDGKPVVRVIDFGVAKAIGQRLTDKTVYTHFAQLVGTPLYMSPEQAGESGLDIDTRSDIYSLGVLLYELLTGTTPFHKERFKEVGYDEMRRIIREEEPPKPSTRISTLGQAATTISTRRKSDPKRLSQLVRGELDWIVMKALEKDRNRRYETASAFAADVQRYLNDEPVLACPPSAWYRFRKFARRNKAALTTVSLFVSAILVALTALLVSYQRVKQEKNEKELALERTREEKNRADENLMKARVAVKTYLTKTAQEPRLEAEDLHALRKDLLASAVAFYEEFVRQLSDDPVLEAERAGAYGDLGFIRQEMGENEQALKHYEQARAIYARLAGEFPADAGHRNALAGTDNNLAIILERLGRRGEAAEAYRQSLSTREKLVKEFPDDVEYRKELAQTLTNLGDLLRSEGEYAKAAAAFQQSITILEELVQKFPLVPIYRRYLARACNNWGMLQNRPNQQAKAVDAWRRAADLLNLDVLRKLLPVDAQIPAGYLQELASAFNNLAIGLRAQGQPVEAEKALRRSVDIKAKLVGDFPTVPKYRRQLAASLNNLALALGELKQREEASAALKQALTLQEKLVADFPGVPMYAVELAGTCSNMGRLVGDDGQLEQSLPWLKKSIEILDTAWRHNQQLIKVRESLCIAHWTRAMTLCGLERFQQALPDWDRALEMDDGRYRNLLRLKRASNLLNLKDHARGTADAQALIESSNATPEDLYNAACVFAISSQIAREDGPLAESYARRAVLVLRQAVAKGFRDVAHLKKDRDLEPLRPRDDFQKMIQELGSGQPESKGKRHESGNPPS
jgi:serine/threonine protein kinase/tetratricopeptide (TPR) repeat protein